MSEKEIQVGDIVRNPVDQGRYQLCMVEPRKLLFVNVDTGNRFRDDDDLSEGEIRYRVGYDRACRHLRTDALLLVRDVDRIRRIEEYEH